MNRDRAVMRAPHSRELLGYERSMVVAEHLAWLNGRLPSEAIRETESEHHCDDSPIAEWSRRHRRSLAIIRSRGNNRKHWDRLDDAAPLIDED